jgi:hypothetical protein
MNTGEGNFDANLENIVAGTPNGGYIGQGNLLLIESKTGAGNPSSFAFSTYSRASDGSAGIFGTPIEVGYNPLGDAAIEYAGYGTAPYIGANGSTEWFSLALGEFSFNSHNTVNFMGTML